MYVLKNLISNLENSLSNKDIFESIVLRTSNVKILIFKLIIWLSYKKMMILKK